MSYRKRLKERAKNSVKEHYGIWVILCVLFTVITGGEVFTYEYQWNVPAAEESMGFDGIRNQFANIMATMLAGNKEEGKRLADENIRAQVEASRTNKRAVMGRSRGVFSKLVNRFTSGAFLVSLTVGISSIVGSDSAAVMLLIIGSLLLMFAVWFLVINLFQVIMIRMFLEGMRYEKIHTQRALFLLKVRKWVRAGLTMFAATTLECLWWFTIIGGVIKHYSYYMVPYIVAENPGITAKEGITLSRNLMRGHKWELFVLQLSLLGWEILSVMTGGLAGIFFAAPYRRAVYCEYYARLRSIGKEKRVPGVQLLEDTYLFELPDEPLMELAYGDVIRAGENPEPARFQLKGIRKFLIYNLGLTIWNNKKEKEFEKAQAEALQLANDREALEGKIYPTRLSPIPEKEKRQWLTGMNYLRCYSVWSVLMIFFVMSFGGWLWEVSLHLIADGVFVNRGVLHGPWLPIYGSGSVLILLLLYRFRKNPALEFLMTVLVCGTVEYFTAYYLEMANHGKKWWDYTGYFLNLDGRICAEGLLVFGVGGMIIVYVLAPVLDNLIRRIPHNCVVAAGAVLMALFLADQAYSSRHPNEGKGITSYDTAFYQEKIQDTGFHKTKKNKVL